MRRVLLATCAQLPNGDEDAELLLAALAERDIAATWQVWDDPGADWTSAPTVIRSTWDYTGSREAFLRWAASVPTLINPLDAVTWSSDKLYLSELAAAGLPVVPTAAFAPGHTATFPLDREFVVKPSVGAGSRGCGRFTADDLAAAAAHAATLQAEQRTVLVQPYLDLVDDAGETALIFFGGRFSHAIEKGPMLPAGAVYPSTKPAKGSTVDVDDLFVEERITPRSASTAELAVGEAALDFLRAQFGADLVYARVDMLPTPDGPVIGELELVEPSLFLSYADCAAARFAEAIETAIS